MYVNYECQNLTIANQGLFIYICMSQHKGAVLYITWLLYVVTCIRIYSYLVILHFLFIDAINI